MMRGFFSVRILWSLLEIIGYERHLMDTFHVLYPMDVTLNHNVPNEILGISPRNA